MNIENLIFGGLAALGVILPIVSLCITNSERSAEAREYDWIVTVYSSDGSKVEMINQDTKPRILRDGRLIGLEDGSRLINREVYIGKVKAK